MEETEVVVESAPKVADYTLCVMILDFALSDILKNGANWVQGSWGDNRPKQNPAHPTFCNSQYCTMGALELGYLYVTEGPKIEAANPEPDLSWIDHEAIPEEHRSAIRAVVTPTKTMTVEERIVAAYFGWYFSPEIDSWRNKTHGGILVESVEGRAIIRTLANVLAVTEGFTEGFTDSIHTHVPEVLDGSGARRYQNLIIDWNDRSNREASEVVKAIHTARNLLADRALMQRTSILSI